MTKGEKEYEKKKNTPSYCLSRIRVNIINNNPRVIKCLQIVPKQNNKLFQNKHPKHQIKTINPPQLG
jgi:hypothetical protein